MTQEAPLANPLLVVISGPSGVGKDAVLERLRAVNPKAHFVTTATTRPPRNCERDGRDYLFLSEREFERLLAEDAFLESAVVYGYRYGVPKSQVREALARGQDVIVRVDVQGAATIRQLAPGAVFIFIAPASFDELERRLRRRDGNDSDTSVRMQTARDEMACQARFDHVVINQEGRLDDTVARVIEIIEAERRREGRPPIRI